MKEPFLYKGSEPLDWSFSQVVEIVQLATSLGCLDSLVKEADQAHVAVRIPPETINFVKKFLFHGGFHKANETVHTQSLSKSAPSSAAAPVVADSAAAAVGARNIIESASCLAPPRPPTPGPPVFPPPPGPDHEPPFQ